MEQEMERAQSNEIGYEEQTDKPETQPEPGAQLEPKAKSEPEIQPEPEAQSEPEAKQEPKIQPEPEAQQEPETPPESEAQLPEGSGSRETEAEAGEQTKAEGILDLLKRMEAEQERIKNLLLRLDRRFDAEILNAGSRDTQVRAFYNELQDYKAGLIEKYMKNVLYDMADMRESIKKQAKRLKDRGEDSISLEEFLEYGEDLKSILEKYEVSTYHGQAGIPIDALRQKITRRVETPQEELGKTVAESLSDGYEYHGKILYPEKISVYVYAPGDRKEKQ